MTRFSTHDTDITESAHDIKSRNRHWWYWTARCGHLKHYRPTESVSKKLLQRQRTPQSTVCMTASPLSLATVQRATHYFRDSKITSLAHSDADDAGKADVHYATLVTCCVLKHRIHAFVSIGLMVGTLLNCSNKLPNALITNYFFSGSTNPFFKPNPPGF